MSARRIATLHVVHGPVTPKRRRRASCARKRTTSRRRAANPPLLLLLLALAWIIVALAVFWRGYVLIVDEARADGGAYEEGEER